MYNFFYQVILVFKQLGNIGFPVKWQKKTFFELIKSGIC